VMRERAAHGALARAARAIDGEDGTGRGAGHG
jgi:hypothetical protein